MSYDNERFDEAVRELARKDGVDHILSIPGVWEIVSEYYNNDVIQLCEDEADEERDGDIDDLDDDRSPDSDDPPDRDFDFTNAIVTGPGDDVIDTVRQARDHGDHGDDGTRTEREERRKTEKPD